MTNHKKRSFKKLLVVPIVFILLIIGISFNYFKPSSNSPKANLMKLRHDTMPTFWLQSQLTYSPQLMEALKTSYSLDASKPLNIVFQIEDSNMDLTPLVNNLIEISSLNNEIYISMIPNTTLNAHDYISLCETFLSDLEKNALNNINLIWYPQSQHSLKAYKSLELSNIGIILNTKQDLEFLDTLHKTFGNTKNFYVQDYIANHYDSDTKAGANMIYSTYYDLAINHAYVQTIFCPYLSLPAAPIKETDANDFSALHDKIIYTDLYRSIYDRLLSTSWTTTKNESISSISPYEVLNEYDNLSGKEELILAPTDPFMKDVENGTIALINYRINTLDLVVQAYAPYVLSLDTTKLPNGINRFKLLPYDHQMQPLEVSSIDLVVNNDNVTEKALDQTKLFPLSEMPVYSTDYIPILMYHTISDTVAKEDENSCVETKVFDAQMKGLVDAGYTSITFTDLWNYVQGKSGLPEKPFLVTMDDGYLNNYTNAYPIYKKYNISATFFVSSFYMKDENTERHFGWNAAKEMEQSGLITIESHGYDHTPLTQLSLKDVKYHVSLSKGLIEQHLGKRTTFVVAYPQFRNNYFTRKALTDLGTNFQITKLAQPGTVLKTSSLKRINVPNTMTPDELVHTIEELTQS